ncbi:MAG: alpha/beta hydrolase [Bryobacteraceae bacterium]|nr:alpha/beta hydrolase [Bryobacteraceae bacterium]
MSLFLRVILYAAVIWGALLWIGRKYTYFPTQGAANDRPSDAHAVIISTADGEKLSAWWFPSPGAKLATLYLHGNGGHLPIYVEHLAAVRSVPQSLLIIDYRGYGESTGSPSETGLYTDGQAAYDWLKQRGYPGERIVVQGWSLGSAVAVDVASRNRVGGLVLEAPLSSARAVAATILPVIGWTLPLGFDSLAKIPAIRSPLLVIHGDRDRVIQLGLGRDLYAAAQGPKEFLLVPGAGHEDLPFLAGARYQEALRRLYARVP